MLVRFQYIDGTIWEGHPRDAAQSPELGVLRMWAIDDFDRQICFIYDDFYYVYPVDGGWLFGSNTPKREYILEAGRDGALVRKETTLPSNAIVRLGKEVSFNEARRFDLIKADGSLPHAPQETIVVVKGDG